MVLLEFGTKISRALAQMTSSTVIDDAVFNKLLNTIATALLQADVDVHLVKKMTNNIRQAVVLDEIAAGHNKRKIIHATVIKELFALLDPGAKPFQPKKGKSNVIMLVGLQGAGKTTTCTKFAYYYKRKGWKTALVCADTFRAGAFDQLKQNATKAHIPFYGSYTERDPAVIAEQGVEQFKEERYEIIIVDTSGRHKQENALFEEMKEIAKSVSPDEVVFVMDSSIGQAAKEQAMAFRSAVDVGSVIITKLDGHAKGGGALSAVAATQSPIIFIGTGEHIEDLEAFNTQSFVSRLLGMGDISALQNLLLDEDKVLEQKELLKKFTQKGKVTFTFRDLYEQFQNLFKLGPISKIMEMVPGMSQLFGAGKISEEDTVKRFKRWMSAMDSMTQEELDSDDKVFQNCPKRIERVARGAGVHPVEVQQLLGAFHQFKQFASKMKQMTNKQGLNLEKMGQGLGRGRGNQRNMQQQLAQMFNPRILQQMGGAAGLQNMMRQMASGGGLGGMGGLGGLGNLQSMMQNLGGLGGLGGLDMDDME